MSKETLQEFAKQLNLPKKELLQKFKEIGIALESGDDIVSDEHKKQLMQRLKSSHNDKTPAKKRLKITRRKQPGVVNTSSTTTPTSTEHNIAGVQVETRRRKRLSITFEEDPLLQQSAKSAKAPLPPVKKTVHTSTKITQDNIQPSDQTPSLEKEVKKKIRYQRKPFIKKPLLFLEKKRVLRLKQ